MTVMDDRPAPEAVAPRDAVVCRDLSYRFGDLPSSVAAGAPSTCCRQIRT
jgi:hypothetical protein